MRTIKVWLAGEYLGRVTVADRKSMQAEAESKWGTQLRQVQNVLNAANFHFADAQDYVSFGDRLIPG